jgi:UDP:flavonoid glycosyltransferase YjiC (YdhE family)
MTTVAATPTPRVRITDLHNCVVAALGRLDLPADHAECIAVNQGGSSTITGARNAGLPIVLIPRSADQPRNATCCSALGVGTVVAPKERPPAAIRAAIRAAPPGPTHAVALLERLATSRRPMITP